MIKTAERNKMRKYLKSGYSKEVQLLLKDKGIVSRKGLPFGESYINHVFNGRNSNIQIEEAIIELYQKRYNEEKMIQNSRKQIFTNKKPEAGTSGSIQ